MRRSLQMISPCVWERISFSSASPSTDVPLGTAKDIIGSFSGTMILVDATYRYDFGRTFGGGYCLADSLSAMYGNICSGTFSLIAEKWGEYWMSRNMAFSELTRNLVIVMIRLAHLRDGTDFDKGY
jgi:hypothetical protein